jgi:hypothetical protein
MLVGGVIRQTLPDSSLRSKESKLTGGLESSVPNGLPGSSVHPHNQLSKKTKTKI